MNVVALGHVCIDRNESENASYVTAGSPAVFIHKIFRQLPDTNVNVIASYGIDFLEYKKDLPLVTLSGELPKTLVYENVSKNNTRSQKALNREYADPPNLTEEVSNILTQTDIVFVAPLMPNFSEDYLKEAFSKLKNDSLKVLIPQGYYRNFDSENNVIPRNFEEENILSFFDLVVVSDRDGKNVFEKVKDWVEKYGILVIVTTGKDGAVAITKDGNINLPANTVDEKDIVDTVGSGDIFSASFAYKYYLTHDIGKSGEFANEIARQALFFTPDQIKIDLSKT